MKYTQAQIDKLPEDHPARLRWQGHIERKEREKGKKERNKKRMKEMRDRHQEDGVSA